MQKTPFWVHSAHPWAKQNFPQYSVLVSFFFDSDSASLSQILKKLKFRFQATLVLDGRMHAQTDKHEFIGPFWLKPGV